MRRAVFAQADAVVGEDMDDPQPHQRGHADRIAAVVAEGEEGAAVGQVTAMQGDAVHDCRHAEFAYTVGRDDCPRCRARRGCEPLKLVRLEPVKSALPPKNFGQQQRCASMRSGSIAGRKGIGLGRDGGKGLVQ